MSVGALEPQFYAAFVELLGVKDEAPGQFEFDRFDEMRALFTETFKSRTQAEWVELFEGTDACVAGIIPLSEAKDHPHMRAREVFVERYGVVQPTPAPRFSRTEATLSLPPSERAGIHTRVALEAWGDQDVDGLLERGAAVQA
jgi:alpha-methylacyl-CoA racemase